MDASGIEELLADALDHYDIYWDESNNRLKSSLRKRGYSDDEIAKVIRFADHANADGRTDFIERFRAASESLIKREVEFAH